ncbi:hypothetical protein MNBD_GAMMA10-1495 [hydrothermal vent metagenome]|uniref:Uncharacterized protein n=1 Tax=hydrothermal vent metagenome TaxID=652676 RepID=A0A3B0Y9F5_9ZZZZ
MILNILKNIKKEIVLFLLAILISTSALVISQTIWKTAQETQRSAQSDLKYARERYHTALDRQRLLLMFEKKYNTLIKIGIVGEENRLNWVNIIETATARFKIPYLKYRIEKRRQISSSHLNAQYPGITLFKSPMTFDMQLLHEGDLYIIINHLDKTAKGLFDIQSCTISRNHISSSSLLDSITDKNFTALCKFNWYTINKTQVSAPGSRNNI